ncbi:MAG: hypothetical protein JJE04_09840 [Acidobacteriia bacterium]|nr:hypothetical protein [Terriglobia bacterium]
MAKSQTTATYDDVNLLLRLYDMRREEKLRKARAWFFANCYPKSLEDLMKSCPPGSDENSYMRMVVSYWDMTASFIKAGVLNKELFFESNRELLLVWERVKPTIAGLRETYKDPHAYHNLETVASAYAEWLNERSPGSYEAFVAVVTKPR